MYGSDIDIDGGWRYSAGGSFSEPRHAGYTCWIKRKPDPDEIKDAIDDELYQSYLDAPNFALYTRQYDEETGEATTPWELVAKGLTHAEAEDKGTKILIHNIPADYGMGYQIRDMTTDEILDERG